MLAENIIRELSVENKTKILLMIMDGLGGIPCRDGKTELELAKKPNLDALASRSSCGLSTPIDNGITPGSGPAHLSVFGYDPIKHRIGRGVLEALGVGIHLDDKSLAARGNFATIDDKGIITDRRAGRIKTEKNIEICKKLQASIKEIDGVEIIIEPGKEHRFVVVFRGENLNDNIQDADPQKEGKPLKYAFANDSNSVFATKIINKFIDQVNLILKNDHPANTALLRGIAKTPPIPTMKELFKIKTAAIATYPMYRGLAKLVGMDILNAGETIEDEIKTLKENFNNYDFFYLHIKKTDSYGEDGNTDKKIEIIETVDKLIPEILGLNFDVVCLTGDHSTPSIMKGHSWHPNPFLIYSKYIIPDDIKCFTEKECAKGILGRFHATDAMQMMLSNAARLEKFGA